MKIVALYFCQKNPVIKPHMDKVLREESKLDIEWLVEKALSNIEIEEI